MDAVGLILELAQKGEVDPWDIDVVQLTDRFLASLGTLSNQDLAPTGQALFYASVLLRMKAQILEARTFPQPEIIEDEPPQLAFISDLPSPLERVLKRRLSSPQSLPERPLTLEDLIAQLREAERLDRQRPTPTVLPRRPLQLVRTMEEVTQLAHHENLEELIAQVGERVRQAFRQDGFANLEQLVLGDTLGTFLALLFLAARALVNLEQEDFYGEVRITPGAQWVA